MCLLISIIGFLYAKRKIDHDTCVFIFCFTWVFNFLGEIIFYQQKYSIVEFCGWAAILVGQFYMLNPTFLEPIDHLDGEL